MAYPVQYQNLHVWWKIMSTPHIKKPPLKEVNVNAADKKVNKTSCCVNKEETQD